MKEEMQDAFVKGYVAALEWVLNDKPTRNQIKSRVKCNKLEE